MLLIKDTGVIIEYTIAPTIHRLLFRSAVSFLQHQHQLHAEFLTSSLTLIYKTNMSSQLPGTDDLLPLLQNTHIGTSADSSLRVQGRSAEQVHQEALDASFAQHERLREIAERALLLHNASLANDQLRWRAAQEEELVRIQTERAIEQCRIRDIENKARQIPKPAPRLPTPPPPPPPVKKPEPPPIKQAPPPPIQPVQPLQPLAPQTSQPPAPSHQAPPVQPSQVQPPAVHITPQPPSIPLAPIQPSNPLSQVQSKAAVAQVPSKRPVNLQFLPETKRYEEILKNIKTLKHQMAQEMERNKPLKDWANPLRRKLRPNKLGRGAENREQNNLTASTPKIAYVHALISNRPRVLWRCFEKL